MNFKRTATALAAAAVMAVSAVNAYAESIRIDYSWYNGVENKLEHYIGKAEISETITYDISIISKQDYRFKLTIRNIPNKYCNLDIYTCDCYDKASDSIVYSYETPKIGLGFEGDRHGASFHFGPEHYSYAKINDWSITKNAETYTLTADMTCAANELPAGSAKQMFDTFENDTAFLAVSNYEYQSAKYLIKKSKSSAPISTSAVNDVDGNGRVNVADATKLLSQIIAKTATADINGDGSVNIKDVTDLLKIIAG